MRKHLKPRTDPNGAFSAIYKQADLLQDAKRLFEGSPNAQGMEKLFSEIADQSDTWLGRTMEFVAAADVGGAGKLVKVTGRLDNLDKSFIDIIATDSIIQVKTTYQAIREAGKRGFQNAGLPNVNRTMLYLSISKQIAREAAQLELPFKVIVGNGQLASFPAEVTQFAQEAGILLQETTKKIK